MQPRTIQRIKVAEREREREISTLQPIERPNY